MTRSDRALVGRLADGDEEALGELLERYWEPACRLGARLTGDRALAADVAQEAFVRLLQRADEFQAGRAFKPWFFQIVRNVAVDQRRSRQRRATRERRAARPEREDAPAPDDEREAVWLGLAQLPADLRQALALKYLDDMTYGEVAEVLGCPEGTAASRVRRGLESLRTTLGADRVAAMSPLPLLLVGLDGPAARAPAVAELLARARRPSTAGLALVVGGALAALTSAGLLATGAVGGATAGRGLAERPAPSSAAAGAGGGEAGAEGGADAGAPARAAAASPPAAAAAAGGGAADRAGAAGSARPTGPEERPVRVVLIDGATDQPLPGVVLELTLWFADPAGERSEARRRLRTDGAGRCELALPARTYGVRGRVGERVTDPERFDAGDEAGPDDDPLQLRLAPPGATVGVRVVDRGGRPVPGASVRLLTADPEALNAPFSRLAMFTRSVYVPPPGPTRPLTGADGSLDVPGVAPGSYLALARAGGRLGRFHPVTVERSGVREEVEVALDAVCPTADLRLRVRVAEPDRVEGDAAHLTLEPHGIQTSASLVEDAVWPDLPAEAELVLTLAAEGHQQVREGVMLRPGEDRLLEVRLPAARPLTGRVLLPDGTPAPGGRLRVAGSSSYHGIDGDGRFSIPGGAAGPLTLVVEASGWQTTSFPGLARDEPHTLRLPQEPSMELLVRDAAGEPLPGVGVTVLRKGSPRRGTTDASGCVRLTGVAGELLPLLVRGDDHRRRVERTFRPGHTTAVVLGAGERATPTARRVAGRVVDAAGAPLGGVEVRCTGSGRCTSDAEGRFAFDDVPAGRVALRAYRADLAPAHRTLELAPGEVREGLQLRPRPGTPVVVELVGPRVDAVRWLTVTRAGDAEPTHRLRLDEDPRLDLGQLTGGAWRVTARGGGAQWSTSLDLPRQDSPWTVTLRCE